MVPESLRFLQSTIESHFPFNDAAVAELRETYPGIEIDRCIRAHIANICGSTEMQVSQSVIDTLTIYPDEQAEAEQVFANTRFKYPLI